MQRRSTKSHHPQEVIANILMPIFLGLFLLQFCIILYQQDHVVMLYNLMSALRTSLKYSSTT